MQFLLWLQASRFAVWVGESINAYPAILTLHTVGLAVLVGANTVVDLRLLGVGREVPLGALRGLFPAMWFGLALNTATGVMLFVAAAAEKGVLVVFYVKLVAIALAIACLVRIKPIVYADGTEALSKFEGRGRWLAACSLLLWALAIAAGRLMAYA